MADDELELDLEEGQESRENKRIKDLSEKVKLTSQERDELAKAKEQAEAEKTAALKEVDFFKNFNPLVAKYPGSAEFQDKIKERVMGGYDAEEATVAVLVKEGKYIPPVAPTVTENPAGGSAVNTIKSEGNKPLNEMSKEERKAALEEAIAKGEIGLG